MKLSPIVLFVYNRPKHTQKVLSYLKKNKLAKKTKIIIYIDKPEKSEDLKLYSQVVAIIEKLKGFKSKKIIFRNRNFGLAKNFIEGISETLKKYESIIVLEDDNLVSQNFLSFMNQALNIYKNEAKVSCIYGYIPKFKNKLPKTFFLRGSWTFTWGTGIWRRSWRFFEKDAKKLLKKLDNYELKEKFNFDDTYDWYSMLERCAKKQNQSWSVRWHASNLIKNTYTLYPCHPLCKNIGMDGSGINTPSSKIWDVSLYRGKINVEKNKISESPVALAEVKKFFNLIEPKYIKNFNLIKKRVYNFFN